MSNKRDIPSWVVGLGFILILLAISAVPMICDPGESEAGYQPPMIAGGGYCTEGEEMWTCDAGEKSVVYDSETYVRSGLSIAETGSFSFFKIGEETGRFTCAFDEIEDRFECNGLLNLSAVETDLSSDQIGDDSDWGLTSVSAALDALKTWHIVATANTACATSCGGSVALLAQDMDAAGAIVTADDAAADRCKCSGPAS